MMAGQVRRARPRVLPTFLRLRFQDAGQKSRHAQHDHEYRNRQHCRNLRLLATDQMRGQNYRVFCDVGGEEPPRPRKPMVSVLPAIALSVVGSILVPRESPTDRTEARIDGVLSLVFGNIVANYLSRIRDLLLEVTSGKNASMQQGIESSILIHHSSAAGGSSSAPIPA
jgi:hypothetical protein